MNLFRMERNQVATTGRWRRIVSRRAQGLHPVSQQSLLCESVFFFLSFFRICLSCGRSFCSRYVHGDMLKHHESSSHLIAVSTRDLSFWCFSCDSYIAHRRLGFVANWLEYVMENPPLNSAAAGSSAVGSTASPPSSLPHILHVGQIPAPSVSPSSALSGSSSSLPPSWFFFVSIDVVPDLKSLLPASSAASSASASPPPSVWSPLTPFVSSIDVTIHWPETASSTSAGGEAGAGGPNGGDEKVTIGSPFILPLTNPALGMEGKGKEEEESGCPACLISLIIFLAVYLCLYLFVVTVCLFSSDSVCCRSFFLSSPFLFSSCCDVVFWIFLCFFSSSLSLPLSLLFPRTRTSDSGCCHSFPP